MQARRLGIILVLVTLLGTTTGCDFALDAALYVDEITPAELALALDGPKPPLVIEVVVEGADDPTHLAGAVALPLDAIPSYLDTYPPLPGTTVVTVCRKGVTSLSAAAIVRGAGVDDVVSLTGGKTRWAAEGLPLVNEVQGAPAGLPPLPTLELTTFEQLVETVSGFGLKPTYMLLAAVLIVLMRRLRDRGIRLVWYSLIAFLAGETFCALNFLVGDGGDLLEILHGLGMVIMGVLLPYGLFVMLDEHVLKLTDPKTPCVGVRFCKLCSKRDAVTCGAQRLFTFFAPALALVSLMPLTAPIRPIAVTMPVFSEDVPYLVSLVQMLVHFRLYPLLAAAAFSVSFVVLLARKDGIGAAALPFFVGLGFMGFSLMRFFLVEAYGTMPVWMDLWEELTELIAIAGVGLFVVVFRRQLGFLGASLPSHSE